MGMIIKNQSTVNVIRMNQSLIHIKHNITILQYKYWHLILKFFSECLDQNIQKDIDGFYYESRSKFAEYIGYDAKTKDLENDIEALRVSPIIINFLEKDGQPVTHGMGFISEYKITSTRIGFRLPSFIEKVIRGDEDSKKMFLLLNWNIFNSFTSKYEAIIYKLCKDYIGVGRTPYLSIDEYREYIGLKDNEYTATDNLTRRCITVPVKNINQNQLTDISVAINYKKTGRKIDGLYFSVKRIKTEYLPFEEPKTSSAFDRARIFISPKSQVDYLTDWTEEQIKASIHRANDYIDKLKSDGKPVKKGAIYHQAITQNWGQQILDEKKIEHEIEIQKKEKMEQEKQEREKKKINTQNKLQKEQKLIDKFESYTNDQKTEIVEKVLASYKSNRTIYADFKKSYEKYGLDLYKNNPIFKANLVLEIEKTTN